MTQLKNFFLLGLVGAWLGTSTLAAASSPLASEQPRIAHGEEVETCGFAPVVAGPADCTATLVHPKVVICAAHCGANRTFIGFGEQGRGPSRQVEVDYCQVNPDYDIEQADDNVPIDWAFCVLKEEVLDLPVIPPALGCEIEKYAQVGQEVIQVGFGDNAGVYPETSGYGPKRWATNTLTQVLDNGALKVGPNDKHVVGCPGDSGGPLLVRLPDQSYRTIGITSVFDGDCGNNDTSFNHYAPIADAVAWIEKSSGIDITPCFADDGTWEPTEACGNFYAGDGAMYGDWQTWCADSPKSGLSDSCGDPHGQQDEDPPSITINKPSEEQVIEVNDLPVKVEIQAKIDDGTGQGVAKAHVQVDGKTWPDSERTQEPWVWQLELDAGAYEVEVVASDKNDNSATSPVRSFTVKGADETGEEQSSSQSDDSDNDDDDDDNTDPSGDSDSESASSTSDKQTSEAGDDDDGGDDDDDGGDDDDDTAAEDQSDASGCGCGQPRAPKLAWLGAIAGFLLLARRRWRSPSY